MKQLLNWFFLLWILGFSSFAPALLDPHCSVLNSMAERSQKDRLKDQLIDNAIDFESSLRARYDQAAPAGASWFQFLKGSSKVLVLAPHATSQVRNGRIKQADSGTGAMARMLHQVAHASILWTVYRSPEDPNYYDDNAFKEKLSDMLRELKPDLVLDLHASDVSRPYDVDLGTRHGSSLLSHPEYLDGLKSILQKNAVKDLSENFFSADKALTDTKWVSNLGTPCIQVEINEKWLSPLWGLPDEECSPAARSRLYHLLQALIEFVGNF